MKINFLPLIVYILAIAALSAFALIYEQPAIVLFILMLLILFPLSLSIFLYANSKYEFSLSYKTAYVEEPNSPVFLLEYVNNSRFPLFSCDVYFNADNRFYPNELTHKLSIPLTQKKNSFSIPVESYDIGLISVHITKIVFHDYLSLFKKEVDITFDASVPVLPKERNIGDFPPAVPKDGPDEFTESDNIGNISSEVKEIREYRPGDRLQRIHWKLSAKLDDLFVKEMAHTSSLAIILVPELSRSKIHDTAQTLLSCIKVMYEKKERFEVCIYNDKATDYSFFTVTNEEEMIEAMVNFYCQPLYDGEENALDTYINSSGKIATVIHIVGKKILIGE